MAANFHRSPRPGVAAVLLLVGALVLSGCASMPSGGEVRDVPDAQRADSDSQMRVYGVKPQPGEEPLSLVRGFLEATTSDEADYRTARQYLTKERARDWRPAAGITVLSSGPSPHTSSERSEAATVDVNITGTEVARIDQKNAYSPVEESYYRTFQLVRDKGGEWRIDSLPDGLILSQADFQRIYSSVNMYYFAQPPPGGASNTKDVLVPDPVYLRRWIDPVTATVRALLAGPTDWLAPAVKSEFPAGTKLLGDGLAVGDSGTLRVPLSDQIAAVGSERCERMAGQLLITVSERAPSVKVAEVRLTKRDGSTVCALNSDQASRYDPDQLAGTPTGQYFIDTKHRLLSLGDETDEATAVPGPLGSGKVELRYAGVRRDERLAAGVTLDGRELRVAGLRTDAALGAPVLTSTAQDADDGLTAPSWDGLGNLWVADRNPADSRLVVLRGGKTIDVSVTGLDGGRIESLRVAADGVRIALAVRTGGGTTLWLGRVHWAGTADHPEVSVDGLRPAAPKLEKVTAASWAGGSRLIVVGRESQGVQQLQYVDTDGSTSYTATVPGISGVTAVAASEEQSQPLLAHSNESGDRIYRLRPNTNWKAVDPKGTAPVYPG